MQNRLLPLWLLILSCCWGWLISGCAQPEPPIDAQEEHIPGLEPPLTPTALRERVEAAKKKQAIALESGGWLVTMDAPEVLTTVRLAYPWDDRLAPIGPELRALELKRIKHTLQSGNPKWRSDALVKLTMLLVEAPIEWDDTMRRLVYGQLHDDETYYWAMNIVMDMDSVHAQDTLTRLIYDGELDESEFAEAIFHLGLASSPNDTTIAFLNMLLRGYGDHRPARGDSLHRIVSAMLMLHDEATAAQRQLIEDITMPYLMHRNAEFSNIVFAVFAFSKHPKMEMLPFFEAQLGADRCTGDALKGIAALRGTASRDLVLEYLWQDETAYDALEAVPLAFAGAVDSVFEPLRQLYGRGYVDAIYQIHAMDLVWEMGGARAAYAFAASFEQASDGEEIAAFYHDLYDPVQPGHPLWTEAKQLTDLGMLSGPVPQKQFEEIQEEYRMRRDHRLTHALLEDEERLAMVKSQSSLSEIVYSFMHASHHLLDSLEYYFIETKRGEGPPRGQVWFIFKQKAYYVEAPRIEEQTNVAAVAEALNFVLQDNGAVERFCKLAKPILRVTPYSDGQNVHLVLDGYLFVDPKIAPRAVEVLGLQDEDWLREQ